MEYRLITLGQPSVEGDGGPVDIPLGKPFALLVRLALAPGPLDRSTLAGLLWPDAEPSRARQSVRQALSKLRTRLGPDVLVGDDPVTVDPSRIATDVAELRSALASGDLAGALDLWRGAFLAGFSAPDARPFERWAEGIRSELDRRLEEALVRGDGAAGRGVSRALADRAVEVAPHLSAAHVARVESRLAAGELEAAESALREAESRLGDPEALADVAERLSGLRAERDRADWSRPRFEFADRGRELRALLDAWDRAAGGHRELALVRGAAGLGKTRLARELSNVVRAAGGAVVWAKALSSDRHIEYGLVADLVASLLALPGAAGTSPGSDRVLRSLLPSRRSAGERPGVTSSLPAAVTLADALADLIGAVAYEAPLLLVCDDMQWADEASVALLVRVTRLLAEEPVLIVHLYREETATPEQLALEEQAVRDLHAIRVPLGPLPGDAVAELLAEAGIAPPGDAADLARWMDPVTRGNPLFVRLMIEELETRGLLGDGGVDLQQLPGSPPMPEPVALELRRREARAAGTDRRARRRRFRWIAAGAAMVVVVGLVFAAWSLGLLGGETPYGGGRILVLTADGWLGARPDGPPRDWTFEPLPDTLPVDGSPRVYRLADSRIVWFRVGEASQSGSTIARLGPDGDPDLVLAGPGDINFGSPSPDGRWVGYAREDTAGEVFRRDVVVARRDGSDPRVIYRGTGSVYGPDWSTDGQRLAIVAQGRADTLRVLSTRGDPLESWVVPRLTDRAWCAGAIAAITATGDEHRLALYRPGEETPRVYEGPAFRPLACSPDGTAALHAGVREGRPALLLRDLVSGMAVPLPLPGVPVSRLAWLPDDPDPVPVAIDAGTDTLALAWGERRVLEATLRYSDGTLVRADSAAWATADPAVASVVGGNQLTGNRPGATRLQARWGPSLRDTVVVRVAGDPPATAVLSDSFARIDTTRWIPVGWPRPGIDTVDDRPVLHLRGDEKWDDGLVLRDPIPAGRGLTVEVEARIPLTARDYQDLDLCLVRTEPESIDPDTGQWPSGAPSICVRYPGRLGTRFDATAVQFGAPHNPGMEYFMDAPPDGEWLHLALQLLPDGEASLWIDRDRVLTAPVHVELDPEERWIVRIAGRAVGTDVHVRRLTVWTEPRMGP